MATPGVGDPGDRGGSFALQRYAAALQNAQLDLAVENSVVQRRRLATQGARTAGPITSTSEPKVVLQSDFVDVVSSTAKTNLVDVVRDADGKMRLYATSGGGGSVTATEVEIDFGASPIYGKTFTVVDAGVSAANKILVVPSGNQPTDGTEDTWEADTVVFAAKAGSGSFTLRARAVPGPISGKRKIFYLILS